MHGLRSFFFFFFFYAEETFVRLYFRVLKCFHSFGDSAAEAPVRTSVLFYLFIFFPLRPPRLVAPGVLAQSSITYGSM